MSAATPRVRRGRPCPAWVIYAYPFSVDVVLGLLLFVGRHSLASRGLSQGAVGGVLLCYGLGYALASLFMARIVRPSRARPQMLAGLAAIAACCVGLALARSVALTLALFCVVPLAVSLFFNAFQVFMLGVDQGVRRPLAHTAGHYTFAWSLGYALGPFASGYARALLEWSQVYLLAAALIAALLVLVARLDPRPPPALDVGVPPALPQPAAQPGLMVPAWVGICTAWMVWNAVGTLWPVQAALLGFGPGTRGAVEFAFALTQSLAALVLGLVGGWHGRPAWLPALGLFGCLGLAVLGAAAAPAAFVAGAVLYGLYTSSAFSLMVYHSLAEPAAAVRRVALNETLVGLSFVAAPLLAGLVHRGAASFGPAYLRLAVVLAAAVAAQTWLAWRVRRTAALHPAPADLAAPAG